MLLWMPIKAVLIEVERNLHVSCGLVRRGSALLLLDAHLQAPCGSLANDYVQLLACRKGWGSSLRLFVYVFELLRSAVHTACVYTHVSTPCTVLLMLCLCMLMPCRTPWEWREISWWIAAWSLEEELWRWLLAGRSQVRGVCVCVYLGLCWVIEWQLRGGGLHVLTAAAFLSYWKFQDALYTLTINYCHFLTGI